MFAGLPELEVWAASQPALLSSGSCLAGNLLAQPAAVPDSAALGAGPDAVIQEVCTLNEAPVDMRKM